MQLGWEHSRIGYIRLGNQSKILVVLICECICKKTPLCIYHFNSAPEHLHSQEIQSSPITLLHPGNADKLDKCGAKIRQVFAIQIPDLIILEDIKYDKKVLCEPAGS